MQKLLQKLAVAPENTSVFGVMYFTFFMSGLATVMMGAFLPFIIDEKSLTYSESGMLLSAHQIGNLLSVLAAGMFAQVIGRKKTFAILGIWLAVGFAIITVSPAFELLFLAFALTGVGRGVFTNLCNATVSEISGKKAAALNLLHGIFAVGALLSPMVVFLSVLGDESGWKVATFGTAVLLAVPIVSIIRLKGFGGAGKKSGTVRNTVENPAHTAGGNKAGNSLAFLKDKSLWVSTLILFSYLSAEASIIGWFVEYFKEIGVLPEVMAQFTPTFLWMMILLGRVTCAILSVRMKKELLLLIISVGVTVCFTGMLLSNTSVPCIAFLMGLGFMMGGVYPTTFSTIRWSSDATAAGFIMATATVGAIVMPGIVGAVADIYGLTGGVTSILAALALMTALSIYKLTQARADARNSN